MGAFLALIYIKRLSRAANIENRAQQLWAIDRSQTSARGQAVGVGAKAAGRPHSARKRRVTGGHTGHSSQRTDAHAPG